jgi:prepilin-type N-terminal cleavage/methylation domain-containing protein
MRQPTLPRRGFSLVEVIVALTILAILGGAMTRLMLSQTRGYQYENGGRRARSAARSAMNILITDLRMTQDHVGISYLDATNHRRVDVKVPVGFGVVCKVSGSSLIIALAPVDSFQLATMKFGGYAVRNTTTGIYSYVAGGAMSAGDVTQCHNNNNTDDIFADTLQVKGRSGSVVQVTGTPPAGTVRGSMAMIWQTVRYSFDASTVYPGRAGLFRIVTGSTTADTAELMAPFSWNSRFSYYTSPAQANDTAATSVPANYNTVRGFKILLAAEAADTVPGRSGPQKSPLTTAVFFKNTRTQ